MDNPPEGGAKELMKGWGGHPNPNPNPASAEFAGVVLKRLEVGFVGVSVVMFGGEPNKPPIDGFDGVGDVNSKLG